MHGYKNTVTWIVSLWLFSDNSAIGNYWVGVAREQMERYDFILATQNVADRMRASFKARAGEMTEGRTDGDLADLLFCAIEEVDWDHLAQEVIEMVPVEN